MEGFLMKVILVVSAFVIVLAGGSVRANLIIDPSFEGTIVYDGPPAFGGWDGFSSTPGTSSGAGFGPGWARTGSQQAVLFTSATNHFAGIYQDILISAGSTVEFEIWHRAVLGSNGQGVDMHLEYRDSVNDMEIGQTPLATPSSLGFSYELFSITGVVPSGADTVRAFYAINSFEGISSQRLYLDDAVLRVVPEPSTVQLSLLGGLSVWFLRRNHCRRLAADKSGRC
jgi:hypothetical protein